MVQETTTVKTTAAGGATTMMPETTKAGETRGMIPVLIVKQTTTMATPTTTKA